MIKRLLRLITDRLRHWQSSKKKKNGLWVYSPTQPTPPSSPDNIAFTLSRSEVVNTLNRTLKHGKIERSGRLTAQSPNAEADEASHLPKNEWPDFIKSLSDSAYLCECQGRLNDAERLYQQALSLSSRYFGKAHPEIEPHLSELARFYYSRGRYSQAQPLLEKMLKIQQQYQVVHPTNNSETLYQLANIHRHLENYGKAEMLYQQVLSAFRQTLGLDHERTQAVYGEFMQMLTTVIESGQFETITAELPPLDLDTLGDTYSWARPDWIKASEPSESYSWIKLYSPPKN